jgi:hypothetical protein
MSTLLNGSIKFFSMEWKVNVSTCAITDRLKIDSDWLLYMSDAIREWVLIYWKLISSWRGIRFCLDSYGKFQEIPFTRYILRCDGHSTGLFIPSVVFTIGPFSYVGLVRIQFSEWSIVFASALSPWRFGSGFCVIFLRRGLVILGAQTNWDMDGVISIPTCG